MNKLIALILTLLIVVSMGACAATQEGTENSSEEVSTSVTSGTDEESAESGQTGETDPDIGEADWPPYAMSTICDKVPDETLRLAFLGYMNNSFWNTVQEGVEKAIDVLANYNVDIDNINIGSEITAINFNNAIDACIVEGYDGILCIPLLDGTEVGINKAAEAGIAVACMCGEAINSSIEMERIFFVGSDAVDMGTLMGNEIVEWLGGAGSEPVTYGIIESYLGSTEDYGMAAFKEVLDAAIPGCTQVGPYEALDQAEKVYSYAKDMLTAYPEMKFIYVSGGGPTGAARAVQELGLTGEVGVFYHDDTEENMAYLETGECIALVSQGAQGQAFDGFIWLYNYLMTGQLPEGMNEDGRIKSNMTVVTEENMDSYK